MDRIPTVTALARRNIRVDNDLCSLCDTDVESTMHLFTGCGFSFGVWIQISHWLKIDPFFAFDFRDILELYKTVRSGKEGRKIVHGIVLVTCWALWKERNDKIFRGKSPNVMDVVGGVKSLSFLWFKHRSRFKHIR